MKTRLQSLSFLGICSLVFGFSALAECQTIDSALYSGLSWRSIGPFRGGRVAAVSGVIGQQGVFYMGLPLGGVWKTTNAGMTWAPVFDSVKDASSVGAVAVAPSDPNVIYVGMGDLITGGGINEGNGVYKSTDAGKTWEHLGLDETKQIPSILVDPHNPDIVLVAAQGNVHKQSEDRGLYRSTDGGKTWTKTLFVDNETGIQKIAWAYDNPSVVLLTTVRHYNDPNGAGRFGGFGGGGGGRGATGPTGTSVYKSTDEGLTWKELKGTGLPRLSGRTCVAIAMHTNSQRMFLVGNFGLYRSDDGGDNWHQMDAPDSRVANGQGGYNCGVYVNSENPDIVYVINTSSYISTDGGKSFTGFKGAPGGDDPQQMWIDPTDGKRLFLGTDQGATVSLDGGGSWSSWYNQATGQVYHISTDNQFPYWVYATQQDSGCIATSVRGNLGEITPLDWLPHPGYEFGYIVADPLNPKISYAGGPAGGIVKVTYPSGQWINVSPSVDTGDGLRRVGNQPIAFSPTNPHELLIGFQYLMSSTDGGMHWKKISPDLGYPKGYVPPKPAPAAATPTRTGVRPQPNGGPKPAPTPRSGTPAAVPNGTPSNGSAANDNGSDEAKQGLAKINDQDEANQEGTSQTMADGDDDDQDQDPDQPVDQQGPGGGGSIESFSVCSADGNTIWAGTNNGLIKVTKDHGRTWEDATIPNLANPTRADISTIDASHQDPATAYVAIDYHNTGDYKPYFYRTHDYGKTWTKIVAGLRDDQPSGSFARVIRADTVKSGLLFAGTESSMYVSFNDGANWQSLMQNLPNTSYRDIAIHGNDLVVGTYGRSFWVLDDISPLREITPATGLEAIHLFKPADAIRIRRNVNGDTPFPPEIPHALNPPDGATIDYYLGAAPSGIITLDVTDPDGKLIRHMSSAPISLVDNTPPPEPDFWIEKPKPIPAEVGTNRINWNLRYDSPPSFSHTYEINANPGLTPASPEGPLVPPGAYKVTLTVDGKSYTQTVNVKNDPRSPARDSDIRAQYAMQMSLYDGIKEAWDGYHEVSAMRTQVAKYLDDPNPDIADAAEAFDTQLAAIGGTARGRGGFGGGGGFRRGGGPPPAPSFVLVNGNFVRQLEGLDSGDMAPNDPTTKAFQAGIKELTTVKANWQSAKVKGLAAFNAVLTKNKVAPISAPG